MAKQTTQRMHYEKKSMTLGYLLAISGGIFWAVGGACAQLLFQECHVTSNWIVPVRLLTAGTMLVGFSALRGKPVFSIWKEANDIKDLLIFGLLGSAMCQYSYYTSIEYSNVALATVLSYMSPIAILLYMLWKEKRFPHLYETASVLLVVAGAYVCATHLQPGSLAVSPEALFWGIICAITFAIYTVQPARLMEKYDIFGVIGWGMVVGGIATVLLFHPWTIEVTITFPLLLYVAGVVVFGTILSFCFYQAGARLVGSLTASILSAVEPVASMIISVHFLAVPLVLLDFVGFVLILATIPIIALGDYHYQKGARL
ncbi:MAG: EamA family transporter [Peptococcaceae bacterium]|nr:EamA family transporter [Peptococcaceae bacterium]